MARLADRTEVVYLAPCAFTAGAGRGWHVMSAERHISGPHATERAALVAREQWLASRKARHDR